MRRRGRVGRAGGARVVARDAGPRPGGDAQRYIPGVVQAAASPAQPGRLAGLARVAAHAGHTS